jgi:formate-dependent nitrite reductase membrane component NrfD
LKELILGKGFFADQVFLNPLEKLSSNSFVNIFYNTGVISLSIYLIFLIIFFAKFFKIRNINNKNFYFSLSHYLILYFFFRSFFEDTLAFASIDLFIYSLCISLIIQKYKEKNN